MGEKEKKNGKKKKKNQIIKFTSGEDYITKIFYTHREKPKVRFQGREAEGQEAKHGPAGGGGRKKREERGQPFVLRGAGGRRKKKSGDLKELAQLRAQADDSGGDPRFWRLPVWER